MIHNFASIGPRLQPGQYEQLVPLAKADDHGVFLPTNPVYKGKELAGYFSIGTPGKPIVLAWLSTEKITSRDSFHLINTVENHVALGGATGVCFPVPRHSPFHPMMKPMGYTYGGSYDFFVKDF